MATINFYLEKRKDKKTRKIRIKNVPILLHFNFDGKRLQHYTGERVDADNWIDTKELKDGTFLKVQKVNSVAGNQEINGRLDALAEDVKEHTGKHTYRG